MEAQGNRWWSKLAAGLGLVVAFALMPGVAGASGGGGCGQPVTDAACTTVEIESFFFVPTIIRVESGREVTFANADPFPHTVLGANGAWGSYGALKPDKDVTYRFIDAGVYPYVCTLHPGMVGAVVVGDGVGGAIDTNTSAGLVVAALARDLGAANAVAGRRAGGSGAWPVLAFSAFGLWIVSVGALAVERKRKRVGSLNG